MHDPTPFCKRKMRIADRLHLYSGQRRTPTPCRAFLPAIGIRTQRRNIFTWSMNHPLHRHNRREGPFWKRETLVRAADCSVRVQPEQARRHASPACSACHFEFLTEFWTRNTSPQWMEEAGRDVCQVLRKPGNGSQHSCGWS